MVSGGYASAPPGLADIILPGSGADKDEHDPERVLGDALHAIREHLGMEVAFVSEFVAGQRVFRYVDAAVPETAVKPGDSHPKEDSLCLRIADGRLPGLVRDTSLHAEAKSLALTQALGIVSHLGVPLRFRDGSVYGTFCCFSSEPDQSLNERDLAVMRVFSEFAARHLERDIARRRDYEASRERIQCLLDQELFALVFQPILAAPERRVEGYEFFTRFEAEPRRSPDKWFAEAGGVDMQETLELAVIKRALSHLRDIPDDIYLAINVSPITLLGSDLPALLKGWPLNRLVLEITEHVSISDYAPVLNVLAELRKRGLRVAVDDAGAGYANFRHILNLKPDIIKLDMSISQHIDTDREARALAAALIGFATETGSTVVAEGVETQAQLDVLLDLEVHHVQGYLLGRPVAFEQL